MGWRQSVHRCNYSGKETQQIIGHNIIDYGARMYDPDLGRWPNMDPLAEKYYSITPYHYVYNNPINIFDYNEEEGVFIIGGLGNVPLTKNALGVGASAGRGIMVDFDKG